MKKNSDKTIEELEQELFSLSQQSDKIMSDFHNKLAQLRLEKRKLFEEILKSNDEKKIKEILSRIK